MKKENISIVQKKINEIHERLLAFFQDVKKQHELTILTLQKKDEKILKEIFENERKINKKYLSLFKRIVYYLNIFKVYAKDFRKLLTSLLICTELERIADFANNLSKFFLEIGIEKFDFPFVIDYWKKIMISFEITENSLKEDLSSEVLEKNLKKIKKFNVFKFLKEESEVKIKKVKDKVSLFFIVKLIDRTNDHLENLNEYLLFKKDFMKFKKIKYEKDD